MAKVLVPQGRRLPGHTAAARKALLRELRRHGMTAPLSSVTVYKRADHLELEFRPEREMSHTQAERLATLIMSAVTDYDRTGAQVSVVIQTAGAPGAHAVPSAG